MKKVFIWLKKELMLVVAVIAAIVGLIITPPTIELFSDIDWRTLGTLLMMLCVLEGFKKEKIFQPLVNLAGKFSRMVTLSLFLVFCVFFSSMFVTNDVSLLIFVPLTIMLFRSAGKEKYILPVITMENIAAIRGSLLMPFGSPQNLFLFGHADVSVWQFMLHMMPLCVMSGLLLIGFIFFLYRKNVKEEACGDKPSEEREPIEKWKLNYKRITFLVLFTIVLLTIVTRTGLWPVSLGIVILTVAIVDRHVFLKVDYVLLATFLCFFIFSSSIASNPSISEFLSKTVANNEYWWAIGLSQIISNVPASIVLFPFTKNFAGLIYGADTAGLCSLIGSLASVINYRLYVREYPRNGKKFIIVFTLISWAFFLIVVIPGLLLSNWNFFS